MGQTVVGREAELAVLAGLLPAAGDQAPRVVVLTGAPGSGKTTLVQALLERAEATGLRVLAARPREMERQLAFSALTDLLDAVPETADLDLPAPQRAALGRALALDAPPDTDADPRVVAAALRGVLDAVTAVGRVLLVVDDAHWLDDATLQVLPHAVRRVSGPVSLLVATRPVDGPDVWPDSGREDLRLTGLGGAALFHLVRQRLGVSLGRGDLRRIEQTSGGNPMFALELALAARSDEGQPVLTPTLEKLVRRSVRGLPPPARRLLLAAALAHDPVPALLGRAAGLDAVALETSLVAAADVATVEGGRVRFVHPLHAAAVAADAGPEDRRAMHRRLAGLETGIEVAARHLALGAEGADTEVAEQLTVAAQQARARGAHPVARDLLALAVAATPTGDEQEPARRLRLAGWALHDGDLQTCAEMAGPVASGDGPHAARAHVLLARRAVVGSGTGEITRACRAALAAAGPDRVLRAEVLTLRAEGADDLAETAGWAREALAALEGLADDERTGPLRVTALGLAGQADVMRRVPGGEDLLAEAVALEARFPPEMVVQGAGFAQAQQLLFASRLDAGRDSLERLLARARELGDEASEPILLLNLGHLELRAGRLSRSGALAREALSLAELAGLKWQVALAMTQVAEDELWSGDLTTAMERVVLARDLAVPVGDPWLQAITWAVTGRLLLARGEPVAAVEALRTAAEHALRAGLADPGWNPRPAELAEALLGAGDVDAAERALATLVEATAGLDRPHVPAVVPRVQAEIRCERLGPDEESLALALLSVERQAALGARVELARSLLVAGRLHRRARRKRDAHDLLTRAVELFEAAPAPPWAARARDELARVGLRPGAPDALTASERRVARLAAAGRTNREIAAEVFASPKTVEATLGRVYRKLGVRSRVELVTALDATREGRPGH